MWRLKNFPWNRFYVKSTLKNLETESICHKSRICKLWIFFMSCFDMSFKQIRLGKTFTTRVTLNSVETLVDFLSLRFYVKSISGIAKAETVPFLQFRGSGFQYLAYFSPLKLHKFVKIEIQSLWNCQNGSFWTSTIHKIDFT